MNASTTDLATLAISMKLTPKQAIALPSVVERCAKSQGWTTGRIVRMCYESAEVKEALASACREVMAAA